MGFYNVSDYENHKSYYGATVGRVANRIANAKFDHNFFCLETQMYPDAIINQYFIQQYYYQGININTKQFIKLV